MGEPPKLTIRLLGTFVVDRDGEPVADDEWRTERNLALLKLLLTRPGHDFTPEELMEHLWPETDPELSRRNLQGRISELRRILEPGLERGGDSSFIETTRAGYRFVPDHCEIDLLRFRERRQRGLDAEAAGDVETAIACYREAASLYRGPPLPHDRHEEWAVPFQAELEAEYVELLTHLVEGLMGQGDYGEALPHGRALLERDPYEEAHWRRVMTCHFERGEPTQALTAYERLQHTLRLEFQVAPSEATRRLAEEIRQASEPSIVRGKLRERARELESATDLTGILERIDTLDQLGDQSEVHSAIQKALAETGDNRTQAA
ncbi:MAG: BTAD domain-containing putative transcriptional regulator, partial [Salinibacter sp.]